MRVLVEPVGKQMPQNLLQELADAIAKYESVIYEINIKTLQRRLVYNDYGIEFVGTDQGLKRRNNVLKCLFS